MRNILLNKILLVVVIATTASGYETFKERYAYLAEDKKVLELKRQTVKYSHQPIRRGVRLESVINDRRTGAEFMFDEEQANRDPLVLKLEKKYNQSIKMIVKADQLKNKMMNFGLKPLRKIGF